MCDGKQSIHHEIILQSPAGWLGNRRVASLCKYLAYDLAPKTTHSFIRTLIQEFV